jgi:Domain of Unknown Function with PDB structure (DUF3857)
MPAEPLPELPTSFRFARAGVSAADGHAAGVLQFGGVAADEYVMGPSTRGQGAERADVKGVATLLLWLVSSHALAAQKSTPSSNAFTKYSRYVVRYDVNADGTHVETHEWAMQVLSEQGISNANSASFSYSDSLQDAEILAAYTLKQDGRRIDAPSSNYQVRSDTGDGSAPPMFSDTKTRSVVLPEVAVGDTIVFSYRLTQKEALFPGYFSMAESFSKFEVYDHAEITLSAPESLGVRVQARDVEGGELHAEGDRRRWAWTFRNTERVLRRRWTTGR